MGTIFALSWLITWYGHVLSNFHHILRLYDFFLASHPLMPIYFAAAVRPMASSRVRCARDGVCTCTCVVACGCLVRSRSCQYMMQLNIRSVKEFQLVRGKEGGFCNVFWEQLRGRGRGPRREKDVSIIQCSPLPQIVLHREEEVLASDCDMASLHQLLSHIPPDLPYETLVLRAHQLFQQLPHMKLAKQAALQLHKR